MKTSPKKEENKSILVSTKTGKIIPEFVNLHLLLIFTIMDLILQKIDLKNFKNDLKIF